MLRRSCAAPQRGSVSEGVPVSSSRRGVDDSSSNSNSSSSSSSRSSSSGYWVPSWLCACISYSVVLLHLWSSYLLLQRGPSHFFSLQLVLLAVNGVYVLAFRSLALQVKEQTRMLLFCCCCFCCYCCYCCSCCSGFCCSCFCCGCCCFWIYLV